MHHIKFNKGTLGHNFHIFQTRWYSDCRVCHILMRSKEFTKKIKMCKCTLENCALPSVHLEKQSIEFYTLLKYLIWEEGPMNSNLDSINSNLHVANLSSIVKIYDFHTNVSHFYPTTPTLHPTTPISKVWVNITEKYRVYRWHTLQSGTQTSKILWVAAFSEFQSFTFRLTRTHLSTYTHTGARTHMHISLNPPRKIARLHL